ncbi:MAG: hypothetical protein ACOC6D_06165 [Atribacterota bacterium]
MKKLFIIVLILIMGFTLTLAINGYGPGDGISDGPDDGSGYGSDDNGNGQGPGKGKEVENTEEFTTLENPKINNHKDEENSMFKWMRKIAEMFQNMFRRMFSVCQ